MALKTLTIAPDGPFTLPTAPATFLYYIHLQLGPKPVVYSIHSSSPSVWIRVLVHHETTSDLTSSKSSLLRSSAQPWPEFQC